MIHLVQNIIKMPNAFDVQKYISTLKAKTKMEQPHSCAHASGTILPRHDLALPLAHDGKSGVVVTGCFKSGTSVVTSGIERSGYSNLADEDNSKEMGFGRAYSRYRTRESKSIRAVNQLIVHNMIKSELPFGSGLVLPPAHPRQLAAILNITESLPQTFVLKDPLFVYTLPIWLACFAAINFKVKVVLVCRDQPSLTEAWHHAPITKGFLKKYPRAIQNMINTLLELCFYLRTQQVPFEVVTPLSCPASPIVFF